MIADLVFNLVALTLGGLVVARARRVEVALLAGLLLSTALAVVGGRLFGRLFLPMRLLSWSLFLHLPLLLGFASWRIGRRWPAALAGALLVVGADAFLVEPRMLDVTTLQVRSPLLRRPWRVALVADLQTDRVGEREREVLRRVLDARPDLVLFAGDYLQIHDDAAYEAGVPAFQALLRESGFVGGSAPPAYAVQGNMEWRAGWERLFEGSSVIPVRETRAFQHEELTVYPLSFAASFAREPLPDVGEGFSVLMGHGPDFALGDPPGNLLLAGHTHGGQVRLPLLGPLITFSKVPRAWASGLTRLGPDQTLYVSRGVGMERGDAPRLRFNCLPELVFLELAPGPGGGEAGAWLGKE